jgi:hypothetical protein
MYEDPVRTSQLKHYKSIKQADEGDQEVRRKSEGSC